MFDNYQLPDDLGFQVREDNNKLLNLRKINIFIGKNNVGKSRLIRILFSINHTYQYLKHDHTKDIPFEKNYLSKLQYNVSKNLANQLSDNVLASLLSDLANVKDNSNQISLCHLMSLFYILENDIEVAKEQLTDFAENKKLYFRSTNGFKIQQTGIEKATQLFKEKIQQNHIKKLKEWLAKNKPQFLYFPNLRGLRPIQLKNAPTYSFNYSLNNYTYRTVNDYFKKPEYEYLRKFDIRHDKEKKPLHFIHTGLDFFQIFQDYFLTTLENRDRLIAFEKFLSENFFEGKRIGLIPNKDKEIIRLKVEGEQEQNIYNLGDGLQQIIILTFQLFINPTQPLYVFIEEPELFLHPQWQKVLLNVFKKFPNQQFFISTHSHAFIDDDDTAVFRLERENEISTIRLIEKNEDKLDLLLDLGYQPSDLLQCNYLLWVEGISDKIYFEYWIKQKSIELGTELIEGTHYSIMFYSGSGLKHLSLENSIDKIEVLKINPNIGFYFDSDNGSAKDSDLKKLRQYENGIEAKKKFAADLTSKKLWNWISQKDCIESYVDKITLEKVVKRINTDATIDEYRIKGATYQFNSKSHNLKSNFKIKLAKEYVNNKSDWQKIEELDTKIEELVKLIFQANQITVIPK